MRRNSKAKQSVAAELTVVRAEAAWRYVSILAPDLKGEAKLEMARRVLTAVDGRDRSEPLLSAIGITPAQVEAIVWANFQCLDPCCPALLFSKQIADELNQFFNPKE
jgi:hypothetical protein